MAIINDTDASHTVNGTPDPDLINGNGGNDTLIGLAGNDTLNGGAGNDALRGGAGIDSLDGGAGSDTASYFEAAGAVTVTLTNSSGTAINDGDGGTDTLVNIERLAGSPFNDTLTITARTPGTSGYITGNDGADTITGPTTRDSFVFADYTFDPAGVLAHLGTGASYSGTVVDGYGKTDHLVDIYAVRGSDHNDTLVGGTGNDHFRAEQGSDSIDGGGGTNDFADYQDSAAGVTVNLATGTAQDGFGGTDTLANIESVYASEKADSLTGDANNNVFAPLGGNDTVDGGGGRGDRVIYNISFNVDPTGPVTVNLATGVAQDGFGNTDTLIEIERATGASFGDTFLGDAEGNRFNGEGGNDTIDGGGGFDWAEYTDAGPGVIVNLVLGTATDGQGGTDALTAIECVIGSNNADVLTGTNAGATPSRLRGGRGNDSLSSPDTATLVIADFADQGEGMVVNLNLPTVTSATLGTDTLLNIRGAAMFGAFNDTITGTGADEWFNPGGGNNSVDAGGGTDTVFYTDAVGALTINLATGTASDSEGGTDTILNFENAAAFFGNDTITGTAGANVINPGAGNDTVDAGAGNDTLDYSLNFATGSTTATVSATETALIGAITVDLAAGTATDYAGGHDAVTGFENAIGNIGNDALFGTADANLLKGLEGNDTLGGGAGADTLDGGGGVDVASAAGATGVVYVDLATAPTQFFDGTGAVDTLASIEGALGGAGNDGLIGDAGANLFQGGAGTDVLLGGGGNDTLSGGDGDRDYLMGGATFDPTETGTGNDVGNGEAGTDVIYTQDGADTVDGGEGQDFVLAGTGADSVAGGLGDDFLFAGSAYDFDQANGGAAGDTMTGGDGVDYIVGGTGADRITGDAGNDILYGGSGADSVAGGDGDDFAFGDAGADTVAGGTGFDYLYGGAGADLFIFNKNDSYDSVFDFSAAQGDKLELGHFGLSLAQLAAIAQDTSFGGVDSTTIDFFATTGTIDKLTIFGIAPNQLFQPGMILDENGAPIS